MSGAQPRPTPAATARSRGERNDHGGDQRETGQRGQQPDQVRARRTPARGRAERRPPAGRLRRPARRRSRPRSSRPAAGSRRPEGGGGAAARAPRRRRAPRPGRRRPRPRPRRRPRRGAGHARRSPRAGACTSLAHAQPDWPGEAPPQGRATRAQRRPRLQRSSPAHVPGQPPARRPHPTFSADPTHVDVVIVEDVSELKIRPATAADAAAVAAIYNEGIEDRLATFETRPREAGDVARMARRRPAVPRRHRTAASSSAGRA